MCYQEYEEFRMCTAPNCAFHFKSVCSTTCHVMCICTCHTLKVVCLAHVLCRYTQIVR